MTPLFHAFNTALLQFIWQGALAAILLRVMLWLLRNRSANARYALSCAVLAVLAVLPVISTVLLYERPPLVRSAAAAVALLPRMAAEALPVPEPPGIDWRPLAESWTLPLWCFGVALFSLRMVWGCTQVAAFRKRGSPIDGSVLPVLDGLQKRMGVTRRVRLLVSAAADGPAVVGWLKPAILLPASALSGLSPEFLQAVLAHELAHVRRHDYLVNLLQMTVETLLFYHPAVWWVSSRIRHERELCCDDLAVRITGGALGYARALTALEKLRLAAPEMAMGGTSGPLFYRIQRVIGVRTQEYGTSRLTSAVAVALALFCGLISIKWAQGQSPAQQAYLTHGDANPQAPEKPIARQEPERAQLAQQAVAQEEAKRRQGLVEAMVQKKAALQQAQANAAVRNRQQDRELIQALQDTLSKTDSPDMRNEMYRVLAEAYSRMGDHTGAAVWLEKASQLRTDTAVLGSQAAQLNRASRTERFLQEQAVEQARMLESLRRTDGIHHPDVVAVEKALRDLVQKMEELQLANSVLRARGVAGRTLARIEMDGLSLTSQNDVLSHLPVHAGDLLTVDSIASAFKIGKDLNPRMEISFSPLENGQAVLRIVWK